MKGYWREREKFACSSGAVSVSLFPGIAPQVEHFLRIVQQRDHFGDQAPRVTRPPLRAFALVHQFGDCRRKPVLAPDPKDRGGKNLRRKRKTAKDQKGASDVGLCIGEHASRKSVEHGRKKDGENFVVGSAVKSAAQFVVPGVKRFPFRQLFEADQRSVAHGVRVAQIKQFSAEPSAELRVDDARRMRP